MTEHANTKQSAAPAPVEHQQAARELLQKDGTVEAARVIGIEPGTLLRVVAGAPVRRGTLALLRELFGKAAS